MVTILFINCTQVSLTEGTEVILEGTPYCPLGACKGFDVKDFFPDPEVAKLALNPKFFEVIVPPNLNNDWSIMASEIGWTPEDSTFRAHYSKSVGVCTNYFTFIVPEESDYSDVFGKIMRRIVKDTGYEGEMFEVREPESVAERDGDHYVWKDGNVNNLTGVEMIFLNGISTPDISLYSGSITAFIIYGNYEDCRKEDPRIPEIPDPRMNFKLD